MQDRSNGPELRFEQHRRDLLNRIDKRFDLSEERMDKRLDLCEERLLNALSIYHDATDRRFARNGRVLGDLANRQQPH